jgi:hypothetical protein
LAKNEQKTPKDTNYSDDKQKGPKKKRNKNTKITTGLFSIIDDFSSSPGVGDRVVLPGGGESSSAKKKIQIKSEIFLMKNGERRESRVKEENRES